MSETLVGYISSRPTIIGEIKPRNILIGGLTLSNTGTVNYNSLLHLPTLEGVEIKGDKTFQDFGLSLSPITNREMESLLK
jgi:hypothetical protein